MIVKHFVDLGKIFPGKILRSFGLWKQFSIFAIIWLMEAQIKIIAVLM